MFSFYFYEKLDIKRFFRLNYSKENYKFIKTEKLVDMFFLNKFYTNIYCSKYLS